MASAWGKAWGKAWGNSFGQPSTGTQPAKLNIDFYRRASAFILNSTAPGDGKEVMLRIGRRRERRK